MPMTNSDARKRLAERHWCNHCAERGIEPVDTLFENVDFTTTFGRKRREIRTGKDQPFVADWCPTCVAVYLKPNPSAKEEA